MRILVIGDPHGKLPIRLSKIIKKNKIKIIVITGDLGRADLARKISIENLLRVKKGLNKKEYTPKQEKEIYMEIYNSTINLIREISKFVPVYSILGNVWPNDSKIKKEEKRLGMKIPYLVREIKKQKNFNVVKNTIRNINGIKIGFLEHFKDEFWVRNFKLGDYKNELNNAKKETFKNKKILQKFGKNNVEILVCHAPPYGYLDKVSGKYGAPKSWYGKHAGSKIILEYVKKYQPKYVLCGHIHEGRGRAKIGKTIVINAGCCGDYFVLDIK